MTSIAIARTRLILTADKVEDGGAVGRITEAGARFVQIRHGADYDRPTEALWEKTQHADGGR
ncbi:hypothetical protein [Streptomyces sp. NPDC046979]|uniref:hypothetical protein n=1 Tax=Streptomyces sp. NPDC046979 TaxID=3154604 RepID=UPI0033EC97A6